MIAEPWQESTRSPVDEKRRFCYVGATRAKKWLGVIYYSDVVGAALRLVVT
jgi:superfamily I DNA/RNA helicase